VGFELATVGSNLSRGKERFEKESAGLDASKNRDRDRDRDQDRKLKPKRAEKENEGERDHVGFGIVKEISSRHNIVKTKNRKKRKLDKIEIEN
jgi:hypothetical protein